MGRRRKNRTLEGLQVEAMSSEGKGIAKHNGKVIFVEQAVPGDVVDIRLTRKRKGFENGIITNLVKESDLRVEPFCQHFADCGGCKWQYLPYEKQLEYKQQIVEDAFNRIAKVDIGKIHPIAGADKTQYFRNKLEFTFSNKRWLTPAEVTESDEIKERNAVGFHVPGMFDKVLDIDHCYLEKEPANAIRNAVREYAIKNGLEFFDIREQHGLLRNLTIRRTTLDETLVLFSFFREDEAIEPLLKYIDAQFPEITALQFVINPKKNDTIYDLSIQTYKGVDFIHEELGDYKFKIGPKSFFQTNSYQAKKLYDITKDFAQLEKTDTLYDLYCGVGSIGIYLSDQCERLTGIEQIEEAVTDAKENAKLNNVQNAGFTAGDVKDILSAEFQEKYGKPDVVVTDPPRAGMHTDVVNSLLALAAPRIIYVSCNPATQARDIALLSEKYRVVEMQAVDMFPHTTHIENVARLELK